jgi:FkbM family methyltransferase
VAYQVVFDREPDDSGRATYEALLSGPLAPRQLVESLLASPEFALRWHRRNTVRDASTREEPSVVTLKHGGLLYVAPWDLLISEVIRDTGVWEPHITALLRRILGAEALFVDVGANIGYFTVVAAQLVGPNGKVVAFEPSPGNVQLLLASVVRNGLAHVDVWPVALSDRPAILGLRTETWNTNASLAPEDSPVVAESTLVAAVPGDSILASIEHHGPCVVKLDVESHEHAALIGIERFLDVHRPTVILEFNPNLIRSTGGDPEELLGWLFERFPHIGCVTPVGSVEPLTSPAGVLDRWRLGEPVGESGAIAHLDLIATHRRIETDGLRSDA